MATINSTEQGGLTLRVLLASTALLAIAACQPVPQEEILGDLAPPERVVLTPPPSAAEPAADLEPVRAIPGVDDQWSDSDLIAARVDNMLVRGPEVAGNFRGYLGQLLEARGFSLETEGLSRAEANAGAAEEWWDDEIYAPLQSAGERPFGLRLNDAIVSAINNSHQIRAFGVLPAIRQTGVREAEGRFTPEAFAEGRIERVNEGSTNPDLTTGEDRLLDDEGVLEFGVRSRLRTGAELTISQRFSAIDTNQTDFDPQNQSASRSTITLIQPLLRGSGLDANNAPTQIARLDTKISQYELIRQVENHLLEVERAYWNLYTARANLLLTRHLAGHGRGLAGQASARSELATDPNIVVRARAARDRWEADVVRSESAVRNAQFRLAALTNAPELSIAGGEFITLTPPLADSPAISRDAIIGEVIARRPELQQAFLQYEAAILREGVAENENLPELDLILEGRLSGRDENADIGGAFGDSEVGGLAGLRFSVPLGYDERDARLERRQLETIQQRHQTRATIATVILEVEVSASEYAVAAKDLEQQRRARAAAQRELQTLRVQWEEGGVFDSPSSVLSDLIDAYERASEREQSVAEARATLAVAAANFNRARGVLLDRWGLAIGPEAGVRGETSFRLNALLAD